MSNEQPDYEFGSKVNFEVGARVQDALEEIAAAPAVSRGDVEASPKDITTNGHDHYAAEHLERAAEILEEAVTFLRPQD